MPKYTGLHEAIHDILVMYFLSKTSFDAAFEEEEENRQKLETKYITGSLY